MRSWKDAAAVIVCVAITVGINLYAFAIADKDTKSSAIVERQHRFIVP